MPNQQRAFGAAVGLVLLVTAGPVLAQAAPDATPYPIRVTYDSTSDSTTRSVELQRGRYFLHFHKPRVIVALRKVVHALLDFGVLLRDFRSHRVHFGLLGLFLLDEGDSDFDFLRSRLALEHDAVERKHAAQIVVRTLEFAARDDTARDIHGHRAIHEE